MQFRRIDYVASGIENKQNMLNVNKDYLFFNPKVGVTLRRWTQINSFIFLTALLTASRFATTSWTRNPEVCQSMKHYTTLRRDIVRTGDILSLNVNYYWMDYRNQLVLTGQVNDVGASIRTNVDKSYRMGLEMEGLLRISQKLSLNANITLSRNKIKDFDEVIYDYGANFDEYNEVKRSYTDTDISFSPNVIAGSDLEVQTFQKCGACVAHEICRPPVPGQHIE